VIDVAESPHSLRASVRIGEVISSAKSATARAVLPYFDREQQVAMLGRAPNRAELARFAATRERGFGLSVNDVMQGVSSVGAPVFDGHGQPMAAIVVSGPSHRLTAGRRDGTGKLLVVYALGLSRGEPTTGIA
jgi:DNA-binding IclR family transcriptional regulator